MALSEGNHLTSLDYYSLQRPRQNSNARDTDTTKKVEVASQKFYDPYVVTGSQESRSSKMDCSSSQDSSASKMEYSSSQESNTSKMEFEYSSVDNIGSDIENEFEPNAVKTTCNTPVKNEPTESVSEIILYDLADSDITPSIQPDFDASFIPDLCLRETVRIQTEKDTTNRSTSKRKMSDEFHCERLLRIRERAILSREEALAKWELAILIREHALEQHAVVLKEQEDILQELFDTNSPMAKRLKA